MKKFLSMFLALSMVFTMIPISVLADGRTLSREIIEFAPLEETEISVPTGTAIEALGLPESLMVTMLVTRTTDSGDKDSGNTDSGEFFEEKIDAAIPVTWTSEPSYDMDTEGVYVFTPVIERLTPIADLPEITVTVGAAPRMTRLLGAAPGSGTNLLVNPGGETFGDYGLLNANGWTEDSSPERGYSYDPFLSWNGITLSPHGGSYLMGFLASGGSTGTTFPDGVSCYQDITVGAQGYYQLSGYLCVRKDDSGEATLRLEAFDDTNSKIGTYEQTVTMSDGDWKPATLTGPIPSGTATLRVTIEGVLNNAGLAAFDDLSLILSDTPFTTVTEYNLRVGSTRVTSENADDVLGDGTVSYTPASGSTWQTLTLNGANITTAYTDENGNKYGILATAALNLVLEGDNTIGGSSLNASGNGSSYALYCTNNLTISGSGTLGVTGGSSSRYHTCAIYSLGAMRITGGTVNAVGGQAGTDIYAISGGIGCNSSFEISGGNVTATGGSSSYTSIGIECWSVTISGGTVTASGATKVMTNAPNLSSYTGVVMASINASGSPSVPYNAADITTYKYLKFELATAPGAPTAVSATAGDAQATVSFTPPASNGGAEITVYTVTSSPGGHTAARAASPITVTGLTNGTAYTFTVTATNSAGTSAASVASNSVTPQAITNYNVWVGGAQVTSANLSGSGWSYTPASGSTAQTLTLNGANITTAYTDASGNKHGIFANAALNLVLTGANNVGPATGSDAFNSSSGESNGIYISWGKLTISGSGSLTASAGYGDNSRGIFAYNGIDITDGTVTATGGSSTNLSIGIGTMNSPINISNGTVNANSGLSGANCISLNAGNAAITISGGTITANSSYGLGINSTGSIIISGGTVTAKAQHAFRISPTLTGYASYQWRAAESDDFTPITTAPYVWNFDHSYIDIKPYTAPTTYTIAYNANGGTNSMANGTATEGVAFTLPANGFTAPSGKRFKAWAIGSASGSQVNAGGTHTFTAATTVYAVWEDIPPATYTVTYKPGTHGTGSQTTDTKTHGIALTLSDAIFTRTGFTQTGWATSDGEAKAYDLRGSYTANAAVDLYPVWTAMTYNITYTAGANGIISGVSHQTVSHGGSSTSIIAIPNVGYHFVSWSDGVSTPSRMDTNVTSNINVTANFEPNAPIIHTITYNANGGTGSMPSGSATEGVAFTLPTNSFTAPSGKRFKVWAIGSASGSQVSVGDTHTFTAATTVYAVWEDIPPATYKITLNVNGGNAIAPDTLTTGANGKLSSLPVPTRSGSYSFDGWFTAVSGGSVITINTVFGVNTTIYAQWTYTGGSSDDGGDGSDSNSTIITPPADRPNAPTQGEARMTGTVDGNGNATVNITVLNVTDAYNRALAQARQNGNEANGIILVLRVDTGSRPVSGVSVNLPKTVQDTIISRRIANVLVVVNNPDIRIGMDLATIREINRQANADINITAMRANAGRLTGNARTAIGSRPVFEFRINHGSGRQVQNFGTGSVSVSIPYILGANESASNVQAVYVDASGAVHWLANSVYDSVNRVLRFSTTHFSTYGVGYKQANPAFTDTASHWAKDDIAFAVSRGLLDGTSATTFSPNSALTRGMFVAALGRLSNTDVSLYKRSSFTDVKNDAYYMGYIEWANKNYILTGVGNGKFAPDQAITRAQMAVIMQNYAKVTGFTLPKVYVENTFADSVKIGANAKAAIKQMQMAGIISSKSGNNFDPQTAATRAEVSAVLRRYVELTISGDTMQGWQMNDSGQWMYYENGKPVTGSKNIDGTGYIFDQYGVMAEIPKKFKYTTYTVQKGDSFSLVAYKLGCTVSELEQLNNKSRFDMIYAGEVLKVPAGK